MLRFIAALLLIPLLDVLLLLFVAVPFLGIEITVALVVLTALLGMLRVRLEGRRTLRKIQSSLVQGEPPTDELVDGALLIAAGAFLLTPGLVTDAVGFLLALPLSRVPIRMALKKYVVVPYIDSETDGFASGNVYIGGFPGDGNGGGAGFTMGGGGFGGNGFDGGPSGDDPDDFPGAGGAGGAANGGSGDGDGGDRFDDPDHADDVVDVDFTVEDEESKRTD